MSRSASRRSNEARALIVCSCDYCRVCRGMIAALRTPPRRFNVPLYIVNVNEGWGLEERCGSRVPVLVNGDRALSH